MRLFRRSLDLTQMTVRPADPSDLGEIARIFRDGARRFYGLNATDLPALLASSSSIVITIGAELYGVVVSGWQAGDTTWLRGLALGEGIDLSVGIATLLNPLHEDLRHRSVRRIYYTGDDTTESWLDPLFTRFGYVPDTEVVVYEKRDLECPSTGNREVRVRPALTGDLEAIVALDRLCFETQWTKGDLVLGPAIEQGQFFVVAELGDAIVGYAYATAHFGGRLIHLVRIAVDPRLRGMGIGVRLLAEVVDLARNQRAHTVTLNTQSYNLHAQRLYRWFGFLPTGERQPVLHFDL